jgi:hypothetical protein
MLFELLFDPTEPEGQTKRRAKRGRGYFSEASLLKIIGNYPSDSF